MDAITYEDTGFNKVIRVNLGGKKVGEIRSVEGGWQYYPRGQSTGGEVFPTIGRCKESLETPELGQSKITISPPTARTTDIPFRITETDMKLTDIILLGVIKATDFMKDGQVARHVIEVEFKHVPDSMKERLPELEKVVRQKYYDEKGIERLERQELMEEICMKIRTL